MRRSWGRVYTINFRARRDLRANPLLFKHRTPYPACAILQYSDTSPSFCAPYNPDPLLADRFERRRRARREVAESLNRFSESRGKGMSATYPEAIPVTLAGGGEKVSGNHRDPVAVQCAGGKFESIKARFKFYPQ